MKGTYSAHYACIAYIVGASLLILQNGDVLFQPGSLFFNLGSFFQPCLFLVSTLLVSFKACLSLFQPCLSLFNLACHFFNLLTSSLHFPRVAKPFWRQILESKTPKQRTTSLKRGSLRKSRRNCFGSEQKSSGQKKQDRASKKKGRVR